MGDAARDRLGSDAAPRRVLPRYTGPRGAEIWAHFPNGVSVPVTRGRVRHYPGLASPAPSTLPYYKAFAAAHGGGRVIDAGCGAGTGAEALFSGFESVVAVDRDPRALAFTQELARGAELLTSSLEEPLPTRKADAAAVVDVLGHVPSPTRFLTSLRASVSDRARLLVAEPGAFVAQRLVAPARRAFSRKSLESALVRGGFHVTSFVVSDGTFVGCIATASDDPAWKHMARAARLELDSPERALAELGLAGKSGCRNMQREALLAEAELRMKVSDGDGAVRAYLGAAQVDPADARPLAGLSLLSLASGACEDALDLAARSLQIDPTLADGARALASAADELSNPEAWNTWRIAQRLSPDDLAIASRVASHAAERGDYAFGIAVFERLRAYGDALPVDYSVTLSLLLAAEGRRADALLELKLARAMAPDDPALSDLAAELQAQA